MKRIVILALLLHALPAHANKASFLGYVKTAEDRFADHNLSSTRSYVDSARKDIARLSSAEQSDAEVRAAMQRLEKLEAQLAKAEQSAATAGEADGLLRKADTAFHFIGQRPSTERDRDHAQECLDLIAKAVAADPGARARGADELEPKCRKALADAKSWLAGDGRQPPDEHDAGPGITKGYDTAKAALANKRAEATDVVAGQKGAEQCLQGLSRLASIVESSSSRKKYYDFDKAQITTSDGKLTLAKVRDTCKAMMKSLMERKVTGCGTKELLVTQDYLGGGRWGQSSYSIAEQFDPIACKDMPRGDKVSRAAAAHRGRFKGLCKGGVIVVDDADWNKSEATDGTPFRALGGTCYARGKLQFKISTTAM